MTDFALLQNSFSSSQLPAACLLSESVAELTASGIATSRLDAEVLLAHVLKVNRARLYANLRESCSQQQAGVYRQLVQRRVRREPLQYITGIQEFWSLEFMVDRQVLIPRPETEVIVETVLEIRSQLLVQSQKVEKSAVKVLDLGTGSGCIAIALASELPHAEIWATDVSPGALELASKNARQHGVAERIRFLHGDLFTPVREQEGAFDVIVSNPPYIAYSELETLQPEVRDWEPRQALDGGTDGLDFYRRLLTESPTFLRPSGWLIMEIGHGQAAEVLRLIQRQAEWSAGEYRFDYAGKERVIVAHTAY